MRLPHIDEEETLKLRSSGALFPQNNPTGTVLSQEE